MVYMDRIQRRRERGFRLPPNTLCVDRTSKYGNPYKMTVDTAEERQFVIRMFKSDLWWRKELVREFLSECEEKGIEHIACFCPLDVPCHGDVWLEVWNEHLERMTG